MPLKDWRTLLLFGAGLAVLGFWQPDAALWIAGGVAAAILLTNPTVIDKLWAFGG